MTVRGHFLHIFFKCSSFLVKSYYFKINIILKLNIHKIHSIFDAFVKQVLICRQFNKVARWLSSEDLNNDTEIQGNVCFKFQRQLWLDLKQTSVCQSCLQLLPAVQGVTYLISFLEIFPFFHYGVN